MPRHPRIGYPAVAKGPGSYMGTARYCYTCRRSTEHKAKDCPLTLLRLHKESTPAVVPFDPQVEARKFLSKLFEPEKPKSTQSHIDINWVVQEETIDQHGNGTPSVFTDVPAIVNTKIDYAKTYGK